MGCETECERENQEGPRETKGDTEKLSKIFSLWGKTGVFYVVLVGAHQPKFAQERKEKKNLSHVANTGD